MRRLPPVLVAVMLAVAVSVGSGGPVLAAKGGNNDNAHACQQGGHVNRFEAETGNPFKNAGDCASHGAQGVRSPRCRSWPTSTRSTAALTVESRCAGGPFPGLAL